MAKPIIVYYVEVGNLPRKAAEKHIKRATKKFRKTVGKKRKLIGIPTRSGESRFDILPG